MLSIPATLCLIHLQSFICYKETCMTDEMSTNRPAHTPHHAHDKEEINPKVAADIAHWSKEFGVTGEQLHEAIRVHGTSVAKVRAALENHKSA